jgi:hypothetical protein
MTRVHLRRRVHHQREPEGRETVRRERHDLRDQAALDSKNIQRQCSPGGVARPALITGDRGLQVGAGDQAAKATESFGAESGPLLRCEEPNHRQKSDLDGFARQCNRLWSARRRGRWLEQRVRDRPQPDDIIQLPGSAIVSRGPGGEDRAPIVAGNDDPLRRRRIRSLWASVPATPIIGVDSY